MKLLFIWNIERRFGYFLELHNVIVKREMILTNSCERGWGEGGGRKESTPRKIG